MIFHWDKLVLARSIGIIALISLAGCTENKVQRASVQVLTYSSLGSEGGFLSSVKKEFEQSSQCELKVETTLGAAQVLSYLDEPKQRERFDVVMGLDQLLFERAKSFFYLGDLGQITELKNILPVLKTSLVPGFIPVDYGTLSFIYRKSDFKAGVRVPTELSDLLKPELKQKWIVQDPRASSPGMLFFLFTDSILKISQMRKQWVTLAPSWDSSYKMFLAKEAPLVWSYLSSLAYHASQHQEAEYGYVDFKEGLPVQIEGMGVLNRVGNPLNTNPCTLKWIHFVLSSEIQSRLVEKQWMMPVMMGVKLPQFFDQVPQPKKIASLDLSLKKVDELISKFGREVRGDTL